MAEAPHPPPSGGAFAVLRRPAFRYIWAASFLSNVGNWMEAVAQSWLVQQQTASALLVEFLAAAEFIPVAILALPAGALADRHDRRKLLLAGQTLMMAFAALLAVLTHLGRATPGNIILLAFLEGAAWASVMPAWQALVPALVPRDELPSAIALNSAQFNGARLLGPMIAGGLLTAAGAALVFDVNVVTFVGILVVLALVRVPAGPIREKPRRPGILQRESAIREALAFSWHERGPRRLLLSLFMFALLAAPVQGLLPVYADQLLPVGAHGYGALLSCLGAGAITGALTLARLPADYPRHHLIPLSMLAFACCALVYGGSTHFVLSGLALGVGGVFWVWSLASANTAMQLLVPDRLRGRAMSIMALANTGALPLGHLLGGVLAHFFGARQATLLTAAGLAAFALWSAIAREPGIDAMPAVAPPRPPRTFREALWEALTAASHRAQEVEPGIPPGSAEPLEE
ncbi:MAG: MFS transporter [Myxococcales bacterium]